MLFAANLDLLPGSLLVFSWSPCFESHCVLLGWSAPPLLASNTAMVGDCRETRAEGYSLAGRSVNNPPNIRNNVPWLRQPFQG
jgi:hypothetical protein